MTMVPIPRTGATRASLCAPRDISADNILKKKAPPRNRRSHKPAPEPPKAPPPEKKKEPEPPKGPQKFSKFSLASVIICFVAILFSIVTIKKSYNAEEERLQSKEAGEDKSDNEAYVDNRTVALAMGAASILCFTVATLCSFYAGMKHKMRNKMAGKRKKHCCLSGFLIASWIVFVMTFLLDLTIMVVAFNDSQVIYPEVVVVGFMGSVFAWMLMFGYSELARRQ